MGMGKNNPKSPQQMRCLWNKLADELNALRGPTSSAQKWRDVGYSHKLINHIAMNEFDERALATFGLLAVDGAGLESSGLNLPATQDLSRTSCIQQSPSPPESHAQYPSRVLSTSPIQSPTVSPEQTHLSQSFVPMLSPSPSQSVTLSSSSESSMQGVTPLKTETENVSVLDGASARMSRGERSKLISTIIGSLSKRNTFEDDRQRREEEQRQEHRETMQAIQRLQVLKPN